MMPPLYYKNAKFFMMILQTAEAVSKIDYR